MLAVGENGAAGHAVNGIAALRGGTGGMGVTCDGFVSPLLLFMRVTVLDAVRAAVYHADYGLAFAAGVRSRMNVSIAVTTSAASKSCNISCPLRSNHKSCLSVDPARA